MIWQIWHKAVAVNQWRQRASPDVDVRCEVCDLGAVESVLHRFWECPQAEDAWNFATRILNAVDNPSEAPWTRPRMKSAIFAARMPRKLYKIRRIWLLLRGIVLWSIWLARNDMVFNRQKWPSQQLCSVIWQGLTDYGRVAWGRVLSANTSKERTKATARFNANWGCHEAVCSRRDDKVTWVREFV